MAKQARRPDIAPEHHVARHCNKQTIDRDPVTRDVRGVFPAAFALKMKRGQMEQSLSMNWFEYFAGDLTSQYKGIVEALRNKRTVTRSSGIARLNAGKISELGKAHNLALRVRDRSQPNNPAYVNLDGMPPNNSDDQFLAGLARLCEAIRIVSDIDDAD